MKDSALHDLRQLLCQEAKELAKRRELSPGDLDHVFKITESIKAIDKIECMEEEGNSYDGGSYDRGSYDGNGTSGRRRRDSMGRYTSDSGWQMDGNYRARGSRDNQTWDTARDNMMRQLDDMESMASTNREKEIIRRARDELREM